MAPPPPSVVHLPNGQTLSVTPVFGGLYFKSNELSHHPTSPFPPGWTIVLNSEDHEAERKTQKLLQLKDEKGKSSVEEEGDKRESSPGRPHGRKYMIHRYSRPTLQNDHMYISSISNPSSSEFKPPTSPTRQLAMMLWATLLWYFHQPEPDLHLTTEASSKTADSGKPRGDWKVTINREGIFKGRVLQKLERMGLISSEESTVGLDIDDRSGEGWQELFVSRKSFWQLDPRIYLFTLSPTSNSPFPAGTPINSRPTSPARDAAIRPQSVLSDVSSITSGSGLWSPLPKSGPFHSTSHLPTFYPPPPPQYVFTNNTRHPIRPKPPRQGEVFYMRYLPSVGQYLSFRVASLSPNPCLHTGPIPREKFFDNSSPCEKSDLEYLHAWMNDPRVDEFWGESGPIEKQEKFLRTALQSRHSIPVIGSWDGRPFGYFEIYWVKEDILGRYLAGDVGDYDRGLHCLVGENEFRGPHRVKLWLSALVHYCWLADLRTERVVLEPRVDNQKLAQYCTESGFFKEKEISFPHKQANLFKIRRDAWEAPFL